jgi:trans-aconitate methyltransferase
MNHPHSPQSAFRDKIADKVLAALPLSDLDTVYDIGSGDGFYSSAFARKAGNVWSFDERTHVFDGDFYHHEKIHTVAGNFCTWLDAHGFEKATQIFFSNSFHDMPCQEKILAKIAQTLPSGSFLNLVEFHLETSFGPPPSIRFSPEQLKSKVEAHGLSLVSQVDLETHYFHRYKKA